MKNFGAISYTSIRIYSLFKSWLKKFGFALSEFICNHVGGGLTGPHPKNQAYHQSI